MDLGIRDKVAFLSGGSQGMVKATAFMLAEEGCKVAIVARKQGPIDETVEAIRSRGGIAMGVSADLSTRDEVRRAVAEVTAELGAPDIAISNIQANVAGDFDDVSDEDFIRLINLYSMSVVYLAREVIPAMKEKRWGRFIAIGSGAAKEPEGMINHIIANTGRPAAVGFMKTLSDEVARYGIAANTVAPGWIATDNMAGYLKSKKNLSAEQIDDWLKDFVPAARAGKPEEIASLIAYLCSDLAGYINGEWIVVDGGKHRSLF